MLKPWAVERCLQGFRKFGLIFKIRYLFSQGNKKVRSEKIIRNKIHCRFYGEHT